MNVVVTTWLVYCVSIWVSRHEDQYWEYYPDVSTSEVVVIALILTSISTDITHNAQLVVSES